MVSRKDLVTLVEAYADAKVSGNEYLIKTMINELEDAIKGIYEENIEEDQVNYD